MRALKPLTGLAALTGAAALAPAAHAATIATTQPCVFANTPNAVVGTGFAPGGAYLVTFGANPAIPTQADGAGSIALPTLQSPFALRSPRTRPFEQFPLTVTDGAGATVASASVQVAQKNAFLTPSRSDIRRTRHLVVSGLTSGVPAYAHVAVQTSSGRFAWRRTRRLGVPQGSCGRLDLRTRFLKGLSGLPRYGVANVYFDSSHAPSQASRPQARLTLTLRRRVSNAQPNYATDVTARGFFDVGIAG